MRPLRPQPAVSMVTEWNDLSRLGAYYVHAEPQFPGPLEAARTRHFNPGTGPWDDLRAGLEGVPSLDHAEPQSPGPLWARHERAVFGVKNLPRRDGPREGTPSNPTLSPVAWARKDPKHGLLCLSGPN
jgi:hypothetical protein